MAEPGDGVDAAAAGFDVPDGAVVLAADIDWWLRYGLDLLALRTALVQAVAKGGTGATTAAAARANLGITADNIGRPGGDTVEAGLVWLGANKASPADVAAADANANARVAKSGDTMSGHLYLPASTAATSGYVNAYINGDGRVSRGASTERVKKFITRILPSSLGNIFGDLFRFQMRTGDGSWRYGPIAERMAENPDQRRFVVFETEEDGKTLLLDESGNPVPLSVDFTAWHGAMIAQLHERVTALEEARHAED